MPTVHVCSETSSEVLVLLVLLLADAAREALGFKQAVTDDGLKHLADSLLAVLSSRAPNGLSP